MSGYFIAATGTGVGKTFTTCALLYALRQQGQPAAAYKPVISGWGDGPETDTAQIITAGGNIQTVEDVSPWRLVAPLSPHIAAQKENKQLVLADIVAYTQNVLETERVTLIEGVGGVAVPLNFHDTTLDWIEAAGLPVILVTGSYLGSISHTLTAIMALSQAGIVVHALVMNETAGSEVTFADAKEGLKPFIGTIPLQIFQPRVSSFKEALAIQGLVPQL